MGSSENENKFGTKDGINVAFIRDYFFFNCLIKAHIALILCVAEFAIYLTNSSLPK